MTLIAGLQVVQRKLVQVVTPSTNVGGNIGPNAVHLLAIKEVCTSHFYLVIHLLCSIIVMYDGELNVFYRRTVAWIMVQLCMDLLLFIVLGLDFGLAL